MSTKEEISKELAATVAGISHDANFKDVDGKSTLDQGAAVYMYLPKQTVMVLANHDDQDVEIWYDPQKTDTKWFENEFAPRIKIVARNYLYGSTIRSYEGDIRPKQMVHRTEMREGRNSMKVSYHPLGNTKIRVAHSKPVTEERPGARSRNIKAIFIEKDGESFRFPFEHLLGARVMALHVESGGKPWDSAGEKILEISRRRTDIMGLLRWSKKLPGSEQITELKKRGENEVIMLRRMMERVARTGDLTGIAEYQLPPKTTVAEDNTMTDEAVRELDAKLDKLLG